jgi:glucose uptake protein
MVIVESYFIAVIMCIITMLCWGSWANTQKLATKKWPFQLFYWDYVIGVVILSLVLGLTMGSTGAAGRSFLADIGQADKSSLGLAFLGGVIFNISNILLVVAISIAGMAVAFPVAVGLALALGVIINYIGQPAGNATVLFIGVTFVVLAILINAKAYGKLTSTSKKTPTKAIVISILAGVLMSFFYRFVADSMSGNYAMLEAGKLSPYSAVFIFSIGIFVSNFVWNTYFMYKPIAGEKVSYGDYFKLGDSKLHMIGIFGGLIWGLGMLFSIIAAGTAGFAISYGLGQGATLIAALWGVFIWKEFKDAPAGTNKLLGFMFASFVIGLGLIIVARIT